MYVLHSSDHGLLTHPSHNSTVSHTPLALKTKSTSDEIKALEANISAIYRTTGECPPKLELTRGLLQMDSVPISFGGMYDVYRGICFNAPDCVSAIKVLRRKMTSGRTREAFDSQLTHLKSIQTKAIETRRKNESLYILPFIGAIFNDSGRIFLWVPNNIDINSFS